MAKDKDPEVVAPSQLDVLAAQNAALKLQLDALTDLVTRPDGRGGHAMVSPAELARTLKNDPMVRPETDDVLRHPSGKPYFNDLRPTGRY